MSRGSDRQHSSHLPLLPGFLPSTPTHSCYRLAEALARHMFQKKVFFNAVNIAFNSFVKSPGAVMLNKDHIVEALEKAKGKKKGIINAGYNVDRPTDKVAKEWSDCLDTAAFAALAGCRTQEKGSKAAKSKQDLYRMHAAVLGS